MNFKRATKRLLVLILALAVVMQGMMFTTNVFAATSAYTFIDATTLDKESSIAGQGDLQFMANRIGSIWPQGYLVYRNIDFGKTAPLTVEATAGARAGHATTVKIMIDKPNSDPIALVPITQIEFAVPETNSAEMLQKVTGVHDVYITTAASTMNFYGFQFFGKEEEKAAYKEYSYDGIYSDVTDDRMNRDIDILKQLGMLNYEEELFNGNMPVTRGEFARAVYGIFRDTTVSREEQFDDSSFYEEVKFPDVTVDNPYAEAIKYLASRGIMNGVEKDEFSPSGFITQIDAAVVIVRALGYQRFAEDEGGYPNGYLRVASKKKLLNTNLIGNDLLRRDEMVSVLRDAIDADYLVPNGVVEDYVSYDTLHSILCETRNVYRGEGVVVADSYSLKGLPTTPLKKNEIEIDGVVYKTGKAPTGGLLGIECEYFYQLKDGVRTIKAIAPSSSTEITRIKSSQNNIHEISSGRISYTPLDQEKKEEIELDNNTTVIYNGVAAEKKIEEMLDNRDGFIGTITYVENGDKSRAVIIEEYADYIIQSLSVDNCSLGSANGKGEVSWSGNDYVFITDTNGEIIEPRKLKVGMVITLYESKNVDGNKLIRGYIADKTVTGRITKQDDKFVYVDDIKYIVSNNYIPMTNEARPALGQESTFTLNIYGEIIKAAQKDPSAWQTGLLMDYAVADVGFEKIVKVKVMSMDAKATVYDLAKKVTADGYKVTDTNIFLNGTEGGFGGIANVAPEEAIRYRINSENKLFAIDTCLPRGNKDHNDTIKKIASGTDGNHMYVASAQLMINKTTGQFVCYANKDTAKVVYFNGSTDRDDRDHIAEVGAVGTVINSTDFNFMGGMYSTTGSTSEADLLVWDNAAFKFTSNKYNFVFESFGEGINANGDIITLVNGWYNGGKETYKLDLTGIHDVYDDSDSSPNHQFSVNKLFNAKPGDIFRLKVYPDGTIERAITYFLQGGSAATGTRGDMDNPADNKTTTNPDIAYLTSLGNPEVFSSEGNGTKYTKAIIGKVTEKTANYMTVALGRGGTGTSNIIPLTASVCIVDKRADDGKYFVDKAEISHISVGDYVYVQIDGGRPQAIVICRDIQD